ncbi:TPA: fimbrial biogenesis chaperone [Morganella morganii]
MKNKTGIRLLLTFICLIMTIDTQASVVMTGTRVIFPSGVNEKTIQFSNPDPQPYIMQLQLTTEDNKPDTKAPFVPLPPVFRMESHSGQTVRLIANGTAALPKDKESVFYLNFTQLPSVKSDLQEKNKLVITITNRVKIFYRPKSLQGNPNDAYKELHFSLQNGVVTAINPTGFYINITSAEIMMSDKAIPISDASILAPLSTTEWKLKQKITTSNRASIKLKVINDYGSEIIKEIPIENH